MSDQPVRWTPLGNLDKDTEYKLVGKGNYTDALDIIKQDDEGQVSGTIQPTKRNKHAFSLGSVQAQNKKYRVTVSGDATKSHALKFLSTKRDYRITTGTGPNGEVEFNGTISSLQSNFNASNLPGAFQVSVSGNTMEFELAPYPHYQWYLESVGDDDVEVVCIQEAIPTDLAGPLKDIGSYDLLGDLFVFSTTQDNEPTELEAEIIGVGPEVAPGTLGGPLTSLTFNAPHGLQEGQWIRITDSNAPWLNGTFVVHNITSTIGVEIVTDTAWGATHPTFIVGQEKVFIHPTGIGEIGVAQKNEDQESWTYTRLLRSVEFNFVSKNAIESFGESSSRRIGLYFTDNYNPPRVFYYLGDIQEDGGLFSPNEYSYGNISSQTSLQLNANPVVIKFVEQYENGGAISPGTKYYGAIQETSNGERGPISPIEGPIIMYQSGVDPDILSASFEIAGLNTSEESNTTSKRNKVIITGLDPSVYERVKVFVIEIIGGVTTCNVIYDSVIPLNGEIDYIHTGFEQIETIDIGEIFSSYISEINSVIKAKNIGSIDSRLVLSNIESMNNLDLSKWAETLRHELYFDEYDEATLKDIGEMQDSFNSNDKLGLMLNETVRFSTRVYISGYGWTPWYWVDDIRVDSNPINQSNQNDNRRDAALPDNQLTSGEIYPLSTFENDPNARVLNGRYYSSNGATNSGYIGVRADLNNSGWLPYFKGSYDLYSARAKYKIPKVKFNVNWDYYVDELNVNLQDSVVGVEFGIGDIPNSVKASGIGVLACQAANGIPQNNFVGYDIFEYPFHPFKIVVDENNSEPVDAGFAIIPNYPYIGTINGTVYEYDTFDDKLFFYSPETIIEGNSAASQATELIHIGSSLTYKCITSDQTGSAVNSYFSILHPQGPDYQTSINLGIEEISFLSDKNFRTQLNNGQTVSRVDSVENIKTQIPADVYERGFRDWDSIFLKLSSGVPPISETEIRKQNRGIVYCQLYNDESETYPSKSNTYYRKIGETFSFESASQNTSFNVDGGDTATSLFYFNHRQNKRVTPSDAQTIYDASLVGIVCQTRVNIKALDAFESNTERKTYPFDYSFTNESFLNTDQEELAIKEWGESSDSTVNTASTNVYILNSDYSFNSDLINPLWSSFDYILNTRNENTLSSRIVWSQRKVQNSLVDNYRFILPLNIKDLDLSFGEINHHENINGELFTVQPRKFQLQYFNARGTLQGSNESVEVLIGDASVLSRDGQTLSSYGTNHKWSVVKGSSPGGKDVIYWFNQENGLFMRFGADGTIVLSERHGLRSFSANNTRWTENQHVPALNYGIRSVWDDRFKEAIWTFIGVRASKGAWGKIPSNELYSEGDTVTGSTFENYPFDGVPDVYISLSNHYPIPQSEPGVGSDWETYWRLADKDDPEYYTVFTLAFNELSNGFSTFYSHLPKTYLKWKNKFLSSHPTERSEIYEHRYDYDKWYEYEGVWKESEPFLEGVVNPFPDQSKKFVAIQSLSDNVPDRIELKTKDHESFLVSTDFDPEDDAWRTPIKNDILTSQTSDPNDDTESLVGSYMRVKFKFFNGAYNKLNNLVVKVRQRLRRTQS